MKSVIALATFALIAGYVGKHDVEDAANTDKMYCEMVSQWHADAHKPKVERAGWPPYRNDIDCSRGQHE